MVILGKNLLKGDRMKWKIIIGNNKCGYSDGYSGCTNKKVREKTGEYHPKCKKDYCPLKVE